MKYKLNLLIGLLFAFSPVVFSQAKKAAPPKPVLPLPSASQMAWHKMETNAFIHFTTNTFTGREWGNGDEKETVFKPTALDASQWATTLKETGFKTILLF